MSVLRVEDLKIGRQSVQGSEDRSSDERLQIPELEVQKIKGKWNVVSEDFKPSIIPSEVNMKVHCADNIVQQTCKSWKDVTFKLQKALCRWEHAKSTFISQRSPFHVSLYKRPLNPEAKEEVHNARNSKNISLCCI